MAAEKELRLPENSSTSSAAGNMRLKRLIKPPVQPVVLGFIGCERPERYSFTARKFLFLGALFRSCGCSVLALVPFSRLFRFRGRFVLTLLQSRARSGIPAVWPECPGAAGGDRIYRFWKSKAEVLSGRVWFSPGFTQTAASRHSTTSG